jgi:hypothetical protein
LATDRAKQFQHINSLYKDASKAVHDYWFSYSNMSTWQFWLLVALLLLPLIALYFLLDRKRALLIGFFGLNAHVWFQYIDTFGITNGLWNYPYKVVPFLPVNLALDTALVPVGFILVYQWTTNHNKNFYFYGTALCLFFAYIFKPILISLGLFEFYKGMNYFYLFLFYLLTMVISKLITDLFVHFLKEQKKPQLRID